MYSFLFRMATVEKGYNSLFFLLDEVKQSTVYNCNLNFCKATGIQKKLAEIVQQMGVSPDELILNQFERLFFDRTPNKRDLELYFFQKRVKYCPMCMRADPFHRLHWDIRSVTICLDHELMLLDRCPSCQKDISIFDLMVGHCRCCAFIEDAQSDKVLNSKVMEAQRVTLSFLTGKATELELKSGTKIDTREYFRIIHLFSSLLHDFDGNHPVFKHFPIPGTIANYLLKGGNERNVQMITAIHTAAYLLLTDPEGCFDQVVQTLEEMTTFPENRFFYKRRILRNILSIKELDVHRHLYDEYLKNLTYVYPRRKNEIAIPFSNYYTLRETLDTLSLTYKQGMRLFEVGILKANQRQRKVRMNTMVKKSEVHAWKLKRKSLLTSEQAAVSLGVHHLRVRELADAGVLTALRGPKVDGFTKRLFDPEIIAAFLQSVTERAILIEKRGAKWMSFHESLLHLHNSGYNVVKLSQAIINGGIKTAVMTENPTLGGLLLHERDVQRLIDEECRKRIDAMGYTVRQTALLLHVGQRKVQRWIDDGTLHVAHRIPKGKGYSQYIRKRDVEDLMHSRAGGN